MAIDFRIGSKVIKSLQAANAPATNITPYPYVGVVKNNLDPTRSGRVQVFIPELGGNPEDSKNWRTVSYASPFMGYTSTELTAAENSDLTNGWNHVTHTYGMWMVPPDIGVEVIIIFVAGDPQRGYWIACVNSNLSRYMLPGMASSPNTDTSNANAQTKSSYVNGTNAPVTEFNENIQSNKTNPNFYNFTKPIHEFQYSILKAQGLDKDIVRGTISSSSQRETPSQVFGISTPGRPWPNDPADDPNYVRNLQAGLLTEDYYRVKTRKGGHTLVMDDGAVLGQDQLMRLRTAGGHQILMHDTEQTVYISHASGDSWIELTKDGKLNIYNKSGFSLRSEGDVNLHSDKNINFNAGGNISLHAKQIANVTSTYSLADTVFDAAIGTWSSVDGQLNSIASIVPTHEPFNRNATAKTTALSSSTLVDTAALTKANVIMTNYVNYVSANVTASWLANAVNQQTLISSIEANLSTSSTGLGANVTALQSNVSSLQSNVTALQSNVSLLQSNASSQQSQIYSLQGNAASQQTLIYSLQQGAYSNINLVSNLAATTGLGIGTTNPGAYQVEIVQGSTGAASRDVLGLATKNTAGTFQRLRFLARTLDTTPVYQLNTDGPEIALVPNNNEAVRVNTLGNVGIGVTSPTVKLDVNGVVKTAGYTVATLPNPAVIGSRAYVTDALGPTYLSTVVGLGTVVCPVFFNGTAWVVG